MGTTYYFVNHTAREYIGPVNAWKAFEIIATHPSSGILLAYAMLYEHSWKDAHIEAIGDPNKEIEGYKDVTCDMIIGYNSHFSEWPMWGPKYFMRFIIQPEDVSIYSRKIMMALEDDLTQFIDWVTENDKSRRQIDFWRGWDW